MKRVTSSWRTVLVYAMVLSIILPPGQVVSEEPGTNIPSLAVTVLPPRIVDLELTVANEISGTIWDANGAPRVGIPVAIRDANASIGQAETNAQGEFRIVVPRGGTYQVVAGDEMAHVRGWAQGMAPPSAVQQIFFQGDGVIRGQVGPTCWGLNNPWVLAGITIAAIAIPIAIYNHRNDRDDASE